MSTAEMPRTEYWWPSRYGGDEEYGTNRLGVDRLPQVVTRGLLLVHPTSSHFATASTRDQTPVPVRDDPPTSRKR